MGQFIQTSGDYNIKVISDRPEGGTITLDTGVEIGNVIVTGNLQVLGTQTTINTTQLDVEDRIITVNSGETGAGVTFDYAGLEVERGSLDNVDFVWNESASPPSWELRQFTFDLVTETAFVNSKLRLKEILTDTGTDNGDLTLIGTGTGVVKITGTSDYTQEIIDRATALDPEANDILTNKGYVDSAIQNNPTYQITRTDTRVVAFDKDAPLSPFPGGGVGPFLSQPAESQVVVLVDNQKMATFYNNGLTLGTFLNIFQETPTNPYNFDDPNAVVLQAQGTDGNIKLETTGTGRVEIPYALQLNRIDVEDVTPTAVPDTRILYFGNIGTGNTGVFHNTFNTTVSDSIAGELVNKNRALLFAMIF